MCCDGKCLFFIKVRTGSTIFGYIAAILSAIGVMTCVGLTLFYATSLIVYNGPNMDSVGAYLTQLCFFENTAAFTFNVLLLYGIAENKPVLLKTYVIYAMIHLVLLLVVMIIAFCILPILGGLILFINGIYTLCIYMVYLTWKTMVTESMAAIITYPANLLIA